MLDRKPIFDEVRRLLGRGFDQAEVHGLDAAIERALGNTPQPSSHLLGPAGKALIKRWEGCARHRADGRFDAYPDPGSADGKPWTIGWGSTGPDIGKGLVWTQEQCDARFDRDIAQYAEAVAKTLGEAPTSQNQFDALVSFHYNTGAIATASLTRLHCRGLHTQAQAEFGKWIYNNRQPMQGLKARRAAEAELYGRM